MKPYRQSRIWKQYATALTLAALLLALIAAAAFSTTAASTPTVQSDFNDGTLDGWTLGINGPFENPGSGGADGGAGDGFLFAVPPSDGRTSYFLAPEKFLGNWLEQEIISIRLDVL